MTDTPRTQAELVSIFADNQDHQITAQDMRDFVVSTSIGGPGIEFAAGAVADDAILNYPTGMDVPTGATTYIPWTSSGDGFFYDPQGWIQFGDDYPSPDWYGATVPAGSWLLLPEGQYVFGGQAVWDNNTTARRAALLVDTCDNRVVDTDPQLDPFAWDPFYNLYTATQMHVQATSLVDFGGALYQFPMGSLRVTRDTAPVAFASSVAQNSGTTRKLLQASFSIIRTSEVGG